MGGGGQGPPRPSPDSPPERGLGRPALQASAAAAAETRGSGGAAYTRTGHSPKVWHNHTAVGNVVVDVAAGKPCHLHGRTQPQRQNSWTRAFSLPRPSRRGGAGARACVHRPTAHRQARHVALGDVLRVHRVRFVVGAEHGRRAGDLHTHTAQGLQAIRPSRAAAHTTPPCSRGGPSAPPAPVVVGAGPSARLQGAPPPAHLVDLDLAALGVRGAFQDLQVAAAALVLRGEEGRGASERQVTPGGSDERVGCWAMQAAAAAAAAAAPAAASLPFPRHGRAQPADQSCPPSRKARPLPDAQMWPCCRRAPALVE